MPITPNDVLGFRKPTDGFLCPLSANKYDIDFLSFTISNYETKSIIFQIGKDSLPEGMEVDFDYCSDSSDDGMRKINYTFSEDVLRLPLISTSLIFHVGKALSKFRMIERHYFKNRLVKSYDFDFGFCIPGSTNTWDAVYDVPPLDEDLIEDMIKNPYETTSDSFYFVDDELVMHNKAGYKYVREEEEEERENYYFGRAQEKKRSYELVYDMKKMCRVAGAAAVGGESGSAEAKGLSLDDERFPIAEEKRELKDCGEGKEWSK